MKMPTAKRGVKDDPSVPTQEELDAIFRRASLERQRKLKAQEIANDLEAMNNRARSVSVGTAFGGTVDLTLRRPDGVCTYAILQPVEAVEIIHQLAAAVGCHINLQPRNDFASWRQWKHVDESKQNALSGGHAPHPEYLEENKVKGRELPPPLEQPGLFVEGMAVAASTSQKDNSN
jgi:hypothetical protein